MKNYRKSYLWVQSGDIVAPFRKIQELKTERFGFFYIITALTVTSCHHYYFIMGVTEKNKQTAYLWVSILPLPVAICQSVKVYCATMLQMLQMYLAE